MVVSGSEWMVGGEGRSREAQITVSTTALSSLSRFISDFRSNMGSMHPVMYFIQKNLRSKNQECI